MTKIPIHTSNNSISWAISHIKRHGDTDILPVPIEYEYYSKIKADVIDKISKIDLQKHRISGMVKMFSPKHSGGFRAVAQFDPIDAILLTSAIGEESEKLENTRIPTSERIACAYRMKRDANGDLFDTNRGWIDFQSKSKEIIDSGEITHVLIADITDFYSQISHHRLENLLTAAGVDNTKSKALEMMLSEINGNHHSRGIPIGPVISIVLAEMCLSDVDQLLLRKGYRFVRYVDDFRVFCKSEAEASEAMYDLTEYLHIAHRLTLQGNKTGIIKVANFKSEQLIEPEEMEEERLVDIINDMLKEKYVPYDESTEGLDNNEKQDALRKAIVDLFNLVEKNKPLNIGLARYVLRRSANKRMRSIYPDLLKNIEFFFPVMKDVYSYIKKVHNDKYNDLLLASVERVFNLAPWKKFSFCKYWMYEIGLAFPNVFTYHVMEPKLSTETDPFLRDRFRALFALSHNNIGWVRTQRETWENQSIWAQRAFVASIKILPFDERMHWLNSIQSHHDISISLMATAVKL